MIAGNPAYHIAEYAEARDEAQLVSRHARRGANQQDKADQCN
jgi:hypothetical protein